MPIKLSDGKSEQSARLIRDMLGVLAAVGIPMNGTDRRRERMALACLAVAGIDRSLNQAQSVAQGRFLTTRQVIDFINAHFQENISPGSYDDIRRRDLLMPVAATLVVNSSELTEQATNNPRRGYALSEPFAELLKAYHTKQWSQQLRLFTQTTPALKDQLAQRRNLCQLPMTLPSGIALTLTPGAHNELQKAIVEQFLPRFGQGAQVLYLGDTSKKLLHVDGGTLRSLGFFALGHEELPDVVAYSKEANLLQLIEAVHSAGPMNELRKRRLSLALKGCTARLSFISCFATRHDFRKWVTEIAWETEVWLADTPEHMIHFNGFKYLD